MKNEKILLKYIQLLNPVNTLDAKVLGFICSNKTEL